ncbi:MAG: dihydroorotase, partial [Firmicutes bacterium]|nr:dihydroorotase [Bacillota bacterium]
MNILIKNGIVIGEGIPDNETNDIYIEDGKIKKIGKNLKENAEKVYVANGKYILPGLIDMHSKICESGYENKDNLKRISNAAAQGGYTTLMTSPTSIPIIDSKTIVDYVTSIGKRYSDVNLITYGAMTKGCEGKEIAEMGEMVIAGVPAVSDGSKSLMNTEILRDVFMYSKMFDIPVVTFCIDKDISGDGVVNSGYMSSKLGLRGIPREGEEIIVARNILLAIHTGARVHLSHITTKGAVKIIKLARQTCPEIKLTASTCPHYFSLTDEAIEDYNTYAKVMPPLRTKADTEDIKEGLLDGTIDIISTGHTPVSVERKKTEFDNAPFGISALETAFSVALSNLVDNDKFK